MKLNPSFIIFFLSVYFSHSQTYIYKNFCVDEGLPSSEIYDMYQDKLGYIWFATDKGLSRYNGYEFENFTTKDGLPGNTILDFYPQDNGKVYCYEYHSKSLFYFNPKFDGFQNYPHNELLKKLLKGNSVVRSVYFDKEENLITGGYGINGLIEISKNGKFTQKYDHIVINEQKSHDIKLAIIPKKNIAFAVYSKYKSTKDTFFLNQKNNLTSRLDIVRLKDEKNIFIDQKLGVFSKDGNVKYYNTKQNPTGIRRINDSLFFVGYYNNGAEIRNAYGKVFDKFLPNKSVSNFLIDKEGGYWLSTLDNGVYYIKNPKIKTLIKSHITSLVKDNKNNLYAGFSNGDIGKITSKNVEIFYNGKKDNPALVEFDKKKNTLYGYSDTNLVDYTNKKTILISFANKLPENIGNPLLKSSNTSFSKLQKDSILHYTLNANLHDVSHLNNTTYIGTSSGLLIQEKNESLPKKYLDSLCVRIDDIDINEKTNTIYMATQDAGVIVYNDSIYSINKDKGLTNNIINEIHIENDSTIWACSHTGLNKISFNKGNKKFSVTTTTTSDGLLSNDIDDIEITNDTVWIATKKGLCFFEKKFLEEKNSFKTLSLFIKEINVNKQRIKAEKKTILNYFDNNIEFKLEAISQKNSNNIYYLYRLKEIDSTWYSTKNRTISFPSLSPGTYTFQSKVAVNGKKSNQEITYSFQILPPFWQSWWFYSLSILIFIGLIYLFFKIRVLTYNKDIARELMRLAIKKLKPNDQFYSFRTNGVDFKIPTHQILYINSQGNYLDIITTKKNFTIRCKIGEFISTTPDALEYLRVHRSYIIRIDQVSSKGKNWVMINEQKIPVGETYLNQLDKIKF
jgi:hypothetical protein